MELNLNFDKRCKGIKNKLKEYYVKGLKREMAHLFVDLSDKPDDFKFILLPTSSSVVYRLITRIYKNHMDISISYYNGLTKEYHSVKRELDCDIEYEKNQLVLNVSNNFIKITDTFEITKKELTDDIINKFRWCEPVIDFPEQSVLIDPYILGLWLGDGHSDSVSLTNKDTILINTWCNYAKDNNLLVSFNNIKERKTVVKENEASQTISYHIHDGKGHTNILLENFKKLNLLNNKHIPECYLKNSREVRLKVLAGLIDTDGYYGNGTYEIVQKNKTLADNILTLSKSLGFFCTSVVKKGYASNTELKTVRDYQRIYIYVNQINIDIPVLVKINKEKQFFHNPKILINNKTVTKKITWTNELKELLYECVKNYQSNKGKKLIPWKKITQEIEEFEGTSPDALRKFYSENRM